MNSETCTKEMPPLRDYELLGLIAEGSMASVYRGRRRQDGQPVAVKVPHPAVANNETLLERFRTEFRTGRELHHPNIVRTLDFGEEGGTCYLVLELVEGPDLWQLIMSRGQLPEAEAVAIIVQAARGLDEAHRHGVIHRDVKPDNILLGPGRAGQAGRPRADQGAGERTEPDLPSEGSGDAELHVPGAVHRGPQRRRPL